MIETCKKISYSKLQTLFYRLRLYARLCLNMVVIHLAICCDSCPWELVGQPCDPVFSGGHDPGDILPGQEAVLQRLDEVEVLDAALGAGHGLTVVWEKVDPLVRMNYKMATRVALKTGYNLVSQNVVNVFRLLWVFLRSTGPRRRCRSCTWCPGWAESRPIPLKDENYFLSTIGEEPDLGTRWASTLQPGCPSLEAAHADSGQVAHSALRLDLATKTG